MKINLKNRVFSSDHLLLTGPQADCHFKVLTNSTKVIELNEFTSNSKTRIVFLICWNDGKGGWNSFTSVCGMGNEVAVSERKLVLQGTLSKIRSCSNIPPAASKPVAPPGERQQDRFVLSTEIQQERIWLSALLARETQNGIGKR